MLTLKNIILSNKFLKNVKILAFDDIVFLSPISF